jgi:hypothetical protein
MNKIILPFLTILVLSSITIANSQSNFDDNWSLRGHIDQENIVDIKGLNIPMAWGKFSTYANFGYYKQSQGSLSLNLWTPEGDERFSMVWDSKKDDCQISPTHIECNAKVTYKRDVEYVSITITYDKTSMTTNIIGPDFEITNIPVKNLLSQKNHEIPSDPINSEPTVTHDIGFIDLSNAIKMIRLEHTNGTDIFEGESLTCNTNYKIWIKLQNFGNFTENVTYSGTIDGVNFSHLSTSGFAPGASTQKSRTVNFALTSSGTYTITINAIIALDDDLSNNQISRQVDVVC